MVCGISKIALCGHGINVDSGTTHDPPHDPEPCAADGDRLVEETELGPGRPPSDIKVRAKPQRIDAGRPSRSSIAKTLDRLMIETTFFATSEKLWGGALQDLRRTLELAGAIVSQIAFDRGAALFVLKVPLDSIATVVANGESGRVVVIVRLQRREPRSLRISIRKYAFGSHFSAAGIEIRSARSRSRSVGRLAASGLCAARRADRARAKDL